jgi:hypothetical protein
MVCKWAPYWIDGAAFTHFWKQSLWHFFIATAYMRYMCTDEYKILQL